MQPNATVNIPADVLTPIVQAQVAAGIVAALGKPEELIAKTVKSALSVKVNKSGVVSNSSYENRYDLIEVLSTKAIHEVVRQSLETWVEEKRGEIEQRVRKSLARQETKFAKALADGLVAATKSHWRISCNIGMDSE